MFWPSRLILFFCLSSPLSIFSQEIVSEVKRAILIPVDKDNNEAPPGVEGDFVEKPQKWDPNIIFNTKTGHYYTLSFEEWRLCDKEGYVAPPYAHGIFVQSSDPFIFVDTKNRSTAYKLIPGEWIEGKISEGHFVVKILEPETEATEEAATSKEKNIITITYPDREELQRLADLKKQKKYDELFWTYAPSGFAILFITVSGGMFIFNKIISAQEKNEQRSVVDLSIIGSPLRRREFENKGSTLDEESGRNFHSQRLRTRGCRSALRRRY